MRSTTCRSAVDSAANKKGIIVAKHPLARRSIALALASTLALSGCATASRDIAGASVSPLQYQSYDCEQLSAESMRINGRAAQLSGRLDEAASNDKAIVGVGMVLFWPALFFLGGTKQQEAEYARLKGESEAVQQVAIQKRCALAKAPASSEPVAPAATSPVPGTPLAAPAGAPAAPTPSAPGGTPAAAVAADDAPAR